MKKNILPCLLLSAFFLFTFFACDNNTEISEIENTSAASGRISGQVKYSNFDETNNSGIIVNLEKTDGLKVLSDSSKQIVTSKDGSFLFENLSEGVYTIYASGAYSSERAVCRNIVVRASETTIVDSLNLVATGSISGKIKSDDKSLGNTGFLVFIAGTSYMSITNDAGYYTISDIPAGNGYQVVVMKNGAIHNLMSNISVTANKTTTLSDYIFTTSELKDQYKGEQGIQGKKGTDGISILWLGAFDDASEINAPQYLNAYFNMTDGCSYIYTGTEWKLMAKSGLNGTDTYAALTIEAEVSTEVPTNQPVLITVIPSKDSLLQIGYVYSVERPNYAFANAILRNPEFVAITQNSEGKYQITATESGYYTIVAKDNDGFTSSTIKYITNIDTTPPASVGSLHPKYNRDTKVLSLTWTNPADSDFAYVNLSYTKDSTLQVENEQIINETYSISNVEVDGDEYVLTVYTTDQVGNRSESLTARITPKIHAIGDILLNDGTVIPYDEYELSFTAEQKQKAVGVLYSIDDNDIPRGWLGLYNSAGGTNSGTYQWAANNTTGYNTYFSAITYSDKDGSDNWAYICSIDPEGTVNAETNYPIFNYANNYASTFGLQGVYAEGWYIPSYSELHYIFDEKGILDYVLNALDGVQLSGDCYWTSSVYDKDSAEIVGQNEVAVHHTSTKRNKQYVCCIRLFAGEGDNGGNLEAIIY